MLYLLISLNILVVCFLVRLIVADIRNIGHLQDIHERLCVSFCSVLINLYQTMNIIKMLCLFTGLFYICSHASGNVSTKFNTDVGISNIKSNKALEIVNARK